MMYPDFADNRPSNMEPGQARRLWSTVLHAQLSARL